MIDLVGAEQVGLDGVGDRLVKVSVVLIDEYPGCDIPRVLLAELRAVDEVGRLEVPEVDFIAQNVHIEQFPDVLLLLVPGKTFIGSELIADLGELLLATLGFGLFVGTVTDISDKGVQATHGGRHFWGWGGLWMIFLFDFFWFGFI